MYIAESRGFESRRSPLFLPLSFHHSYLPVHLSISLCLTAGLNCNAVAEIHSTQCFGYTAFFRFVVVQVCCVVSVPEMKCMLWLVPCSNHS